MRWSHRVSGELARRLLDHPFTLPHFRRAFAGATGATVPPSNTTGEGIVGATVPPTYAAHDVTRWKRVSAERFVEELDGVGGGTASAGFDLVAAAEAVGDEAGVGLGLADRRQQGELGHGA